MTLILVKSLINIITLSFQFWGERCERGGVDRDPERPLPHLADRPALLVLPLLPGSLQEVRGTERPGRGGCHGVSQMDRFGVQC